MLEIDSAVREVLEDLFPSLHQVDPNWAAIAREAPVISTARRRRGQLLSRRLMVVIAVVVALGGSTAALAVYYFGPRSISPANISALSDPTSVAPASLPVYSGSPDERPVVGSVHFVGDGRALVWLSTGELCWSTQLTAGSHGMSGCVGVADAVDSPIPIAPLIGPAAGTTAPIHVQGLAVDAVARIKVALRDGSTVSGVPEQNWYDIELPPSAAASDVVRVTAELDDGGGPFTMPINIVPQSQMHYRNSP
jgi:hypothetical protein